MYGQINRSTDSRSSRSRRAVASSAAVVALTGSSMRFAYRISPSAALTGVLVMLVFLFL